ncbi:MAG: ABC transporter ATP-binding protein [Candidatus Solibacter sp.]
MSEAAIQLRGVCKRYPHFSLRGINLDVPDGTVLGLIGPNGAGKSTLLRILMGLVRADSGRVTVLGREMPAAERWIKARAGFVSEDMALYGAATLAWHMQLVSDMYEGWDPALASDLVDRFHLDPSQPVRGLSRGQHVKAMLLLAMARRADVLILDEPTAGLDPVVRHEILMLLAATRSQRRALIFSSHYGDDVATLADNVAFVHGGSLIAHAPVGQLLVGGRSLEQVFLAQVAVLEGRAA